MVTVVKGSTAQPVCKCRTAPGHRLAQILNAFKLGILSLERSTLHCGQLLGTRAAQNNFIGRSACMNEGKTFDHEQDEHQSMPHLVRPEAVLEGMSVGLFGYERSNTHFSIVSTSGAFAEVTGYTHTEVLGKRLDFFFGSEPNRR
jgi:PAS domain-containing protein